jgi:hypothetical protein
MMDWGVQLGSSKLIEMSVVCYFLVSHLPQCAPSIALIKGVVLQHGVVVLIKVNEYGGICIWHVFGICNLKTKPPQACVASQSSRESSSTIHTHSILGAHESGK